MKWNVSRSPFNRLAIRSRPAGSQEIRCSGQSSADGSGSRFCLGLETMVPHTRKGYILYSVTGATPTRNRPRPKSRYRLYRNQRLPRCQWESPFLRKWLLTMILGVSFSLPFNNTKTNTLLVGRLYPTKLPRPISMRPWCRRQGEPSQEVALHWARKLSLRIHPAHAHQIIDIPTQWSIQHRII